MSVLKLYTSARFCPFLRASRIKKEVEAQFHKYNSSYGIDVQWSHTIFTKRTKTPFSPHFRNLFNVTPTREYSVHNRI